MMKKVRFVVLGCGKIGKKHIDVIQANPEAELVAICDEKPIDFDIKTPCFSTLEKLWSAQIDFDVLCVCTPNGLHSKHAIEALENRKHVVIEKPMALTKLDGEKIIHKALEYSRQVFCVMQNRYAGPTQLLKTIVESGKIGDIRLVQINCFWNRDERYYTKTSWQGTREMDGGVLFTQFAHFIDLLYWVFGDIKNIDSKFKNFAHQNTTDFADTGMINFEFQKGGFGNLCFTTAVAKKNFESTITVIGSKGTFKIGGQYMNEIQYCKIEDFICPTINQSTQNNHQFVIQNVIDVLKEKQSITTNVLEGLKVVEIIGKIYKNNG